MLIVVGAGTVTACGDGGGNTTSSASTTPQDRSATTPTASSPQRSSPAERLTRADLEFFAPHGIAVSPDGSVIVTDTDRSRVLRVDGKGKTTLVAGRPDGGAPDLQGRR